MASITIAKGDTLSKIAKSYGTTVDALASANGITNVNKIKAGATLNIPDAAAPASAAPFPVVPVNTSPTNPQPGVAYLNQAAPAMPTDTQLQGEAANLYNPVYQQTIDALTANENMLTTQYDRNRTDYAGTVDKALKDAEKAATNSLIKRGMARSDRGTFEITQGLADVNASAQKGYAEMLEDYMTSKQNIATQKATAGATLQQNIAAKVMDLKQWYESIRQFNAQQALREQELAFSMSQAGSGGGGGGGGGSSTPVMSAAQIFSGSGKSATYTPTASSAITNYAKSKAKTAAAKKQASSNAVNIAYRKR